MRSLNPVVQFMIRQWFTTFFLCSVVGLFLDPLFPHVPLVDGTDKFLDMDQPLLNVLCVLRSLVDMLFVFHIIIKILFARLYFSNPHPYPTFDLVIYVFAALYLPQMMALVILPNVDTGTSFWNINLLIVIIFCQLVTRLRLAFPFIPEGCNIEGQTWTAAAVNLFCYIFLTRVLGSLWYLFATDEDNFGLSGDALESDVLETMDFWQRVMYCTSWGVHTLSGRDLKFWASWEETIFNCFVILFGMVLRAVAVAQTLVYARGDI